MDFERTVIEVRENQDNWGPFKFTWTPNTSEDAEDGSIPYGTTISSISTKVYSGNAKASTDLSELTEITSSIVDADRPAVLSDNTYKLWFKHPGDTYRGTKASIVFTVTLDSGAVFPFFFSNYLKIK